MKVLLLPNFTKKQTHEVLRQICPRLAALGMGVAVRQKDRCELEAQGIGPVEFGGEGKDESLIAECDLILSIGGDGTMIHGAYYSALYQKPVAGVNVGRLGFLAQIEPEGMDGYLARLASGSYSTEKRYAIRAVFSNQEVPDQPFAINDIVVSKAPTGNIADFKIFCNQKLIDEYLADGIIFSTPTGSTAYALSAGGPVMDPGLATITMVPICPHSITTRPIVFGGEKTISLSSTTELLVVADGRQKATVPPGTFITIGRSTMEPEFITFHENEFFEILTAKIKQRG